MKQFLLFIFYQSILGGNKRLGLYELIGYEMQARAPRLAINSLHTVGLKKFLDFLDFFLVFLGIF